MTEAEWLECTDPESMLRFLWSRKPVPSDRKARLCMIAWCWQVNKFYYVEDEVFSLHAVEQLADGVITLQEYLSFGGRYIGAEPRRWRPQTAVLAATTAEEPVPFESLLRVSSVSASEYANKLAIKADFFDEVPDDVADAFMAPQESSQRSIQADILRHIIGNPFLPYLVPDHLPLSIVQLAESLYNGQDCSFALHDALLEAGHAELAEHFSKEQWHPKGCWVLDLILGKK
jgi:hypothetical protein